MEKVITILLFLVLAYILYIKFQANSNGISAELLRSKLKAESNIGIIDVRSKQEYNGPLGNISGSLSIPLSDISNKVNFIKSKNYDEIYVICLSGSRSAFAVNTLNKNGIKAQNVKGGMSAWNRMK